MSLVADLFLYSYEAELRNAAKWANYLDRRLEFDENARPYTRPYDQMTNIMALLSLWSIFPMFK